MGIDTPTGNSRRLAELDKQIEGRWALINRLFEDVEELIDERDRLRGRNTGLLDRLFRRRHQAPAPAGTTTVRRPGVVGAAPARDHRSDGMRAAS